MNCSPWLSVSSRRRFHAAHSSFADSRPSSRAFAFILNQRSVKIMNKLHRSMRMTAAAAPAMPTGAASFQVASKVSRIPLTSGSRICCQATRAGTEHEERPKEKEVIGPSSTRNAPDGFTFFWVGCHPPPPRGGVVTMALITFSNVSGIGSGIGFGGLPTIASPFCLSGLLRARHAGEALVIYC